MRGNRRQWLRRGVAAAVVLLAAAARGDDPPTNPRPPDAPLPIILKEPADLSALWKALDRPDFVVLRGDEYARLLNGQGQGKAAAPASAAPWSAVVESVAVSGVVKGDFAELTVDAAVTLSKPGRHWVPLRFDGQTLTSAAEGDRALDRRVEAGAWQVELSGRGRHAVRVGLLTRVKLTAEGKRLELAIPEAASTRVSVDVPQRVTDAFAGPTEAAGRTPVRESGLTRLAADLSPRSTLVLSWRVDEDAGAALPPLLVARGDVAVDVDPGAFRTRSTWVVRSVRGTARSLQLRLHPDDEVLELELDGQQPPAGIERIDGATRMTIPLTEPLAQGQERTLTLTTRRPTPAGSAARVAFHGFPMTDAREQTGAIGVAIGGNLWVSGAAGRGVRAIDPRTELPSVLRARPATVRAYQFSEQPFDLTFGIEPSPPLVRSEARTTVALAAGSVRVDTWLDYQSARGRIAELTLGLPPGLEVETIGPATVVGDWQTDDLPGGPVGVGLRLLTVRLAPEAQEAGRFSLHVAGRRRVEASGDVAVPLVQPVGALTGGGRVAVLTDPSLTAGLAGTRAAADGFRSAMTAPPADWPWPAGRPPPTPPALWLRYDDTPNHLPLRVQAHAVELTHATTLLARVEKAGVDVQQETELVVKFGSLARVDVRVPDALQGLWEPDGGGVSARTDLGPAGPGGRAYRLTLAAETNRPTRVRFRFRLPVPARPAGGGGGGGCEVAVPWIRPVDSVGASAPVRATVTVDPGLSVEPPEGWSAAPGGLTPDPASADRLVLTAGPGAEALRLRVVDREVARLPAVVVPRLGLRSVPTPDGGLRTTAWFGVDTQESAVLVTLPRGSDLLRVRVAGEAVRQVERVGGGLRVKLPPRAAAGPVAVELEYADGAAKAGAAWGPPELTGGLVRETLWEVRVPWNRAVVGVPSGWADENEWYWDWYVWKRRPAAALSGVEAWASGAARAAGDPPDGGDHSYLFGRPGGASALPVTVVSRAALVAVCSGGVLAVGGLSILVWRPSVKLVWAASLVLVVSVAAFLHPSVTVLGLQSGTVGVVLTAAIAFMQRSVDRRSGSLPSGGRIAAVPPGSTLTQGPGVGVGVGSDDSTAVRVRPPASTLDHVPAPPAAGDGVAGRGSGSVSGRAGQGGAS